MGTSIPFCFHGKNDTRVTRKGKQILFLLKNSGTFRFDSNNTNKQIEKTRHPRKNLIGIFMRLLTLIHGSCLSALLGRK